MRHFIPVGLKASNGVLIALLGLCLRSRHISFEENSYAEAYFVHSKKASLEHLFHSELDLSLSAFITMIINKEKERRRFHFPTLRCWSRTAGSEP